KKEQRRSRMINLASIRTLDRIRKEGNAVLVFPAGTRYRPGISESKKGVREINSYIRISDVMMLVSINGNCLRFSDTPNDMLSDVLHNDRIIMAASPVYDTKAFREESLEWAGDKAEDKKQAVVDYVMHNLEIMHEENEVGRLG
ncbi:MAG TPA: 1-acyl-sn-glycerol-3-phosphate acyltransferase, partial [Treponema sp.]|nr:1-acyl-sn-glycerol-3-phosphate acyltransferase [Treponema sp.]